MKSVATNPSSTSTNNSNMPARQQIFEMEMEPSPCVGLGDFAINRQRAKQGQQHQDKGRHGRHQAGVSKCQPGLIAERREIIHAGQTHDLPPTVCVMLAFRLCGGPSTSFDARRETSFLLNSAKPACVEIAFRHLCVLLLSFSNLRYPPRMSLARSGSAWRKISCVTGAVCPRQKDELQHVNQRIAFGPTEGGESVRFGCAHAAKTPQWHWARPGFWCAISCGTDLHAANFQRAPENPKRRSGGLQKQHRIIGWEMGSSSSFSFKRYSSTSPLSCRLAIMRIVPPLASINWRAVV